MGDTDASYTLGLEMLADPEKLKPIKNIVNVDKITEERSDDTELINKINKYKNTFKENSDSDSDSEKSNSESESENKNKNNKNTPKSSKSSNGKLSANTPKMYKKKLSKSSSESKSSKGKKYTKVSDTQRSEMRKQRFSRMPDLPTIPEFTDERERKYYKTFRWLELQEIKDTLEEKGDRLTRSFNVMADYSIEEIEDEIVLQREKEAKKFAVNIGKQALVKGAKILVDFNKKKDYFGIDLEGWDEQLKMNIDNYGVVCGEIYNNWRHVVSYTGPEMKLAMMLGISAGTYSYSKKLMKKKGLENLARNNPEFFNSIHSKMMGMAEKKIGVETVIPEKQSYQTKMTKEALYQKMKERQEKEQKKEEYSDDDSGVDVNNETERENIKQFINNNSEKKPKVTKSSRIDNILSKVKENKNLIKKNMINMDETATSKITVETVDSDVSEVANKTKFKRGII